MSPGDALDWIELVDTLDVPTLAVLTVIGFFFLYRVFIKGLAAQKESSQKSMSDQQTAFIGALTRIEERLAAETTELRSLTTAFQAQAAALREHVKNDREDFQRVFDKVEDTRKETMAAIRSVGGSGFR